MKPLKYLTQKRQYTGYLSFIEFWQIWSFREVENDFWIKKIQKTAHSCSEKTLVHDATISEVSETYMV